MEEQQSIAKQLKFIQQGTPTLAVMNPCRVGDGILSLTEDQKDQYRQLAHQTAPSVTLFVPASGSGSRMFEFLKEFIHYPNPENAQRAARFYSRLSEFALFRKLPKNIQKNYLDGKLQLEELIDYLLGSEGLNFGNIPKGLIPFHIQEPFILNPFQEQLLQAAQLSVARCQYHFTIQQEFEKDFKEAIDQIAALTSRTFEVTYSVQDPSTDAFVFKTDGQLLKNADGRVVRRPAGHGTLLRNLDVLDSEYILVKNIDNVQHFSQQLTSNITWEVLLGLLMQIRSDLKQFVQSNDFDGLCSWNERFALFDQQWLMQQKDNAWQALLNRPLRVCGMVKNDGQPGGGPFYVSVNGQKSKQIVEKAQLTQLPNASQLLLQSTHFNPVMMVLSPCDLDGKPHSLENFIDPSTYFVVDKQQDGESVKFVEQPGLWNGAMAHWNTLFVEVPSAIFSPVKSVLDLLELAHQANKGA